MSAPERRADGLRRRDSLLDAALACFSEEGVLSTGIEQIRRRAAASPSSVYHHFSGLDDLSAALLLRTFGRLVDHLVDAVRPQPTAEAAVRALVRAYLEWVLDHPGEAKFLFQATTVELVGSHQREVRQAKSRLQEPLAELFAPFAGTGELPSWSWPMLYSVIVGPSQDACRHLFAGDDIDMEWALAELPGIAWNAVRRG